MAESEAWQKDKALLDALNFRDNLQLNSFIESINEAKETVLYSNVGFKVTVSEALYLNPKKPAAATDAATPEAETEYDGRKPGDAIADDKAIIIVITDMCVYAFPPMVTLEDGTNFLVFNEYERFLLSDIMLTSIPFSSKTGEDGSDYALRSDDFVLHLINGQVAWFKSKNGQRSPVVEVLCDSFLSLVGNSIEVHQCDHDQLLESILNKTIQHTLDEIHNDLLHNNRAAPMQGWMRFCSVIEDDFDVNDNAPVRLTRLKSLSSAQREWNTRWFFLFKHNTQDVLIFFDSPEAVKPYRREDKWGEVEFNFDNVPSVQKISLAGAILRKTASGFQLLTNIPDSKQKHTAKSIQHVFPMRYLFEPGGTEADLSAAEALSEVEAEESNDAEEASSAAAEAKPEANGGEDRKDEKEEAANGKTNEDKKVAGEDRKAEESLEDRKTDSKQEEGKAEGKEEGKVERKQDGVEVAETNEHVMIEWVSRIDRAIVLRSFSKAKRLRNQSPQTKRQERASDAKEKKRLIKAAMADARRKRKEEEREKKRKEKYKWAQYAKDKKKQASSPSRVVPPSRSSASTTLRSSIMAGFRGGKRGQEAGAGSPDLSSPERNQTSSPPVTQTRRTSFLGRRSRRVSSPASPASSTAFSPASDAPSPSPAHSTPAASPSFPQPAANPPEEATRRLSFMAEEPDPEASRLSFTDFKIPDEPDPEAPETKLYNCNPMNMYRMQAYSSPPKAAAPAPTSPAASTSPAVPTSPAAPTTTLTTASTTSALTGAWKTYKQFCT